MNLNAPPPSRVQLPSLSLSHTQTHTHTHKGNKNPYRKLGYAEH